MQPVILILLLCNCGLNNKYTIHVKQSLWIFLQNKSKTLKKMDHFSDIDEVDASFFNINVSKTNL